MPDETREPGLVTRLRGRLAAMRLSANEASAKAGLGLSYANDILSGRSLAPGRHKLSRLAAQLDCDVDFLLLGTSEPCDPAPGSPNRFRPGLIHRTLPPGADGYFTICDQTVGPVPFMPPDMPEAYALVVPDRTMEPRYLAGEHVVAAPSAPVQNGGYALVHDKAGRALLRRVDVLLAETVRLSRLDGIAGESVALEDVSAVHRVVASGDLP